MKGRWSALTWRLPLLVLLAMALTLVFSVGVGWWQQRTELMTEARVYARQDAARLVRTAEKLWPSDTTYLQRELMLSSAERSHGVTLLLDADGIVLFADRSEWVGQQAAGLVPGLGVERLQRAQRSAVADVQDLDAGLVTVLMPFQLPAAPGQIVNLRRGAVYLEVDRRWQLSEMFWRELLLRWPSAVFGLLASVALALWLGLRVGRPLAYLSRVARRVGKDQYAPALFVKQSESLPPEIRELARSLQDMTDQLRETSHDLETMLNTGHTLIWLADPQGMVTFFNTAWLSFTGRSLEQELGEGWMDGVHPDDLAKVRESYSQAIAARQPFTLDYRLRHVSGEYRWVQDDGKPRYNSLGEFIGYLGNSWDVSERKQTEMRLRQLSQAVEQSPESIVITGRDGRIEYVNDFFVQNSGYSRDELIGRSPAMLSADRMALMAYEELGAALGRGDIWEGELVNRRKDGTEYVQHAIISPIRDGQGNVTHYLGVQQDITERKKTEARIHTLAYFDSLTGLPNRTYLLEQLEQVLTHGAPHRRGALVLLNIDRFKHVNDARGQAFGDALLMAVGQRLQALAPADTVLGRMSADEFGFVWPWPVKSVAPAVDAWVQDLLDAFHQELDVQGDHVQVSISVGVSYFDSAYAEQVLDVLRQADTALHQVKRAGGNGHAFYEAHMAELARQRFELQRDLQQCVERGELALYLQPQVDAQGKIVAAEALLRWNHPERGIVPPNLFIPIAEETGQIVSMGAWALREAARLIHAFERAGTPLRVAVNVSPRQFSHSGFVDMVREMLAREGAQPSLLMIEVTESLMIGEMQQIVAKMNALAALGVQFSVDDFGTGYSNLSYLKQLPLTELKVDKSFVQDLTTNPNDAALIETIIEMSHHLELSVVAEGVETQAQAEFLRAHGCDLLQGYRFGRPTPAQDWLRCVQEEGVFPAQAVKA